MTKMIIWLLAYIKFQQKIITVLIVLLTGKDILPKSDTPISKEYQQMQIDSMPIIENIEKLDYRKLLNEYKLEHDRELKPIIRRENSETKVPTNLNCPRCEAPHTYIYDNNGGRGQFNCKVCGTNFNEKTSFPKQAIIRCPHCSKTLEKIKQRNNFSVLKCKNDLCSFYQKNLDNMNKDERKLFAEKPHKFKVRYIYREFEFDYEPLSKSAEQPAETISKVDIAKIHSSPHTLGLILTYYANYGLSARKTAGIMQDVHNVKVSYQTVLNYAEAASKLVKPFVDNYHYKLSDSFCGDETYLKIKGKWQYLFFFFDAEKKIILSYRISPERDTLAAIKAFDDTLKKMDPIPKNLSFVVDANPIYRLAQYFFAEKGIYFDLNQVVGLTNNDKVSREFRPLKQIVERLNRTFKREYKSTSGFSSSAGSETFTVLFVTFFNFLRPHSALEKKVPVTIPELDCLPNMPTKWLKIIELSQEYLKKQSA